MPVVRNISLRRISIISKNKQYQEAIDALNSLQTNAQLLNKLKANKAHGQQNNIERTKKYLLRSGLTLDRVDNELSIIHVTGTKGKGSTCAICESILNSHGYKTGFFSSPHIVSVRERIRINRTPISEDQFTKYFWKVYKRLDSLKEQEDDMPAYFKFLTVMALNVFLAEKVDVAIIEVGIGGQYDCTNIFNKPAVVGISSLGLDHVNLLGSTVEQIAAQKAGIMKQGCLAFTSPQPASPLHVLNQYAADRQCPLWEAPPLSEYTQTSGNRPVEVGLGGPVQMVNASLALQLSHAWMNRAKIDKSARGFLGPALPFKIDPLTANGLKHCSWPGRYQVLSRSTTYGDCTFYLDGAHTAESIQLCAQWFQDASITRGRCKRTLLFNVTGDRDLKELLTPLLTCYFDTVLFCPNILGDIKNADLTNHMVTSKQQFDRCEALCKTWLQLQQSQGLKTSEVKVLSCVTEALQALDQRQDVSQSVLVTGSLHLVGAVLSVLDPHCSSS